MKIEKTLSVLGAAFVLGGCASSPRPQVAALPTPAPTPATAPVCAMNTQAVDTCRLVAPGTVRERLVCNLWVGGTPNQPFVYPYEVLVPTLPSQTTPVVFVWQLLDKGYRFPDAAHGPSKPVPRAAESSPSFSDGDTTDKDDGEPSSGGPERRYRWKFAHPGRANRYDYTIQFEAPDPVDPSKWKTVTCDPTITSSGN